jgi:monothiol glutaredoxin
VGKNTTVGLAFSSASAEAPGAPIQDKIAKDVSSSKVVLYMKGTPQQPQCGFSRTVVQILEAEGVRDFKSFNVLDSTEIREGIKKFSNWPTIPQVYLNGEFIGGSDIMMNLFKSGELSEMLKKAGVEAKPA